MDDSEEMLDKIQTCVVDCLGKENFKSEIFENPLKLLDVLENNQEYDLYLLDIEMEQLNGLELAKRIRKQQRQAYIVFITSHSAFALASYSIQIKAYQYLLKTDIKEKLPAILLELQRDIEQSKTEYYVIQNQRRIERIKYGEITNIYKEGKNAVFVTANSKHYERKTLNKVMSEINRPEFLFIDKGIIVNIRQIKRIEGNEVVFFDDTKVHISRANIQTVKRRVSEYFGGNL